MIRHTASVASLLGPDWQAQCKVCGWKGTPGRLPDAAAEARHHNDTAQPLSTDPVSQERADEDSMRDERTFYAFTRGLEGVEQGAEARRRLNAALSALARMDTLANRTPIEPAPPAYTEDR